MVSALPINILYALASSDETKTLVGLYERHLQLQSLWWHLAKAFYYYNNSCDKGMGGLGLAP
jgi:hypothetical protein